MAMTIGKLILLSRARKPATDEDVEALKKRLSLAEKRFKQRDRERSVPPGFIFECTL